jgi:hypothetical protein
VVRFRILKAMNTKTGDFWDVAQCSLVDLADVSEELRVFIIRDLTMEAVNSYAVLSGRVVCGVGVNSLMLRPWVRIPLEARCLSLLIHRHPFVIISPTLYSLVAEKAW